MKTLCMSLMFLISVRSMAKPLAFPGPEIGLQLLIEEFVDEPQKLLNTMILRCVPILGRAGRLGSRELPHWVNEESNSQAVRGEEDEQDEESRELQENLEENRNFDEENRSFDENQDTKQDREEEENQEYRRRLAALLKGLLSRNKRSSPWNSENDKEREREDLLCTFCERFIFGEVE